MNRIHTVSLVKAARLIKPGRLAQIALGLALSCSIPAFAEQKGMLETIHKHKFLTSTMADNGDVNPYAVIVAPANLRRDFEVMAAAYSSRLRACGTALRSCCRY